MDLVKTLPPEKTNEVKLVSIYVIEKLQQIQDAAICEVLELPDKTTRIHYVADPDLQKLFEMHHRYGPSPETTPDRSICPYGDSIVRKKFGMILTNPNPLTLYQEESLRFRNVIQSFFRVHASTIEPLWIEIAKNWVKEVASIDDVWLNKSASELMAQFLLVGIFGYDLCTEADIHTNIDFWNSVFCPLPSQLHSLEELHQSSVTTKLKDMFGDIKECIGKLRTVKFDGDIQKLIKKIIAYGLSEDGIKKNNFPAYCHHLEFTYKEIEGLVMTLMVAAQETTSVLLTALLYEYAKNPNMQEIHRKEIMALDEITHSKGLNNLDFGFYRAYLEALRMYSPGGAQREAGHDMIIHYGEEREHYIRKGDLIAPFPILHGCDSLVWPNPLSFNPNRDNLSEIKQTVIPFGSGAHHCPGERTAESEILLTLVTILPRVRLYLVDEMPLLIDATVMRSEKDFRVRFELR